MAGTCQKCRPTHKLPNLWSKFSKREININQGLAQLSFKFRKIFEHHSHFFDGKNKPTSTIDLITKLLQYKDDLDILAQTNWAQRRVPVLYDFMILIK